jgi:hypothetical protein
VALDPIDQGVTVLPFSSFGTLGGLWHTSHFRKLVPGSPALYYGSGESGWHAWGVSGSLGGSPTTGTALSSVVDLTAYAAGRFRVFLHWWQFAHFRANPGVDLAAIEVRDGSTTLETLTKSQVVGSGSGVQTVTGFKLVELTASLGHAIRVRFGFDSVNAPIGGEGWFVQDVKLFLRRV